MTDAISNAPAAVSPRRVWLRVAVTGVALVLLAMLVAWAAVAFKPQVGRFVKWWFLEAFTAGVFVGGLMVFVAALTLPRKTNWRAIVLMLWGLVAVTSPLLGIMFLLSWCVLLVMLPAVIVALVQLFRVAA